jgi:hypothetical protein
MKNFLSKLKMKNITHLEEANAIYFDIYSDDKLIHYGVSIDLSSKMVRHGLSYENCYCGEVPELVTVCNVLTKHSNELLQILKEDPSIRLKFLFL